MKIKETPKADRPREKLIQYGPKKLTNSELLAIILSSGTKEKNVLQIAQDIFRQYPDDSIKKVPFDCLEKTKGIGMVKACQIIACLELGKRFHQIKPNNPIISPKIVWQELQDIRDHKKEYFIVFYLDQGNQVIKKETISVGILNASLVHPREVFEPAIKYLAARLIVSHNHPSGDSSPSLDDLNLTKRLVETGKVIGIEVIDHVIVTKDNFFSFKKNKLI